MSAQQFVLGLSQEEAIVLYDLLDRYQRSEGPELVTDAAEWRALVLLCGRLEREGAGEVADYANALAEARRKLGSYDGVPF